MLLLGREEEGSAVEREPPRTDGRLRGPLLELEPPLLPTTPAVEVGTIHTEAHACKEGHERRRKKKEEEREGQERTAKE